MSLLYVTEYAKTIVAGLDGLSPGHPTQAPLGPPIAEQAITIPGTTAPFQNDTTYVLVSTESTVCLGFNAAAVAGKHRMPANDTRFYGVSKATGAFISVVASPT